MKKALIVLAIIGLVAGNLYGGNGDLVVNGNVGVGTSAPQSRLHLQDNTVDGNPTMTLSGGSGSGVNVGTIDFYSLSGGAGIGRIRAERDGQDAYGRLLFHTAGPTLSERMRILSNGNVGIGTDSPGAKLEVAGSLKAGRNYYNVLSSTLYGTPTYGIKIKTNIPFQNSVGMPTVIIEGYCYGNAQPIGLSIVWYVHSNSFAQYKASSWGAFAPPIKLSNENGKVVIFLDSRPYYTMFAVRAYAGLNEAPEWFSGWTSADEAFGGTSQVTVPQENRVNGSFYANSKYFEIRDPRYRDEQRRLVHGSLEGPETGVYYRGEARLQDGRAVVTLPPYFEALTRQEGRTVLLTPRIEDGGDPACPVGASAVRNGSFVIQAYGVPDPVRCEHGVYWEVKAERGDVERLVVERTW